MQEVCNHASPSVDVVVALLKQRIFSLVCELSSQATSQLDYCNCCYIRSSVAAIASELAVLAAASTAAQVYFERRMTSKLFTSYHDPIPLLMHE